jgi:short-subunit dehydrogenase
MNDWKDKIVIVTGAGTGVGEAMCHELASRGAIVYVTARSLEKCQPVADQINKKGFIAYAEPLEVGNFEEFKFVLEKVKATHGKIDVVINNAAIVFVGEYYDMDEKYIEKLVHVNLTSVMVGTLYAYRLMKSQGFGTIVNVSSMGGYLPTAMMVGYSATKHGVIGLTRSLAAEGKEFGVHIKVMCLGLVQSEMLNKANAKKGDGNVLYETVPIKPMPTAKAAKILVNGIHKKGMIIFVPWYAKLYYHLQGILPGIIFKGAVHTMSKYREVMLKKQ